MPVSDPESQPYERIGTALEARNLAIRIKDVTRRQPIVCVTIPRWGSTPFVDIDRLAAELGDVAALYLLPTGDLTWELTALLPPRLDVYGGAVRIWWPGLTEASTPRDHPLIFVHAQEDSDRTIAEVVGAFAERGLVEARAPAGPLPGTELQGIVRAVRPHGAELRLEGDIEAFVTKSDLSNAELDPCRVVRVGQRVRAVVQAGARRDGRIPVSLRPFQPPPWQRVAQGYAPGMLVDGIVVELRNIGAIVELLPGARGLLRNSRIRPGGVSHPEDELRLGERIVARIESLDTANGKAELSWLDVPDDEEPEEPLSLLPDGPPWLPPVIEDAQAEVEVELSPPVATTPASIRSNVKPPPTADEGGDVDDETSAAAEVELLEEEITKAYLVRRELEDLAGQTQRRLAELRGEASQMRRELERDLIDLRTRILESARGDADELIGSTEGALSAAREEIARLQEELTAVQLDRSELLQRFERERLRASDAEQAKDRLRREARARDRTIETLDRQLVGLGASEEDRFVAEIRAAWEHMTAQADRERFPWTTPVVGPDFLESLRTVQGISRAKVVDACAHVASSRAAEIPGLELHPLRESDAGGAPQRTRDDGAKAWRCSLQAGSPAARRLHYWQLPAGRVELAKVVYHDDFSIR
jgi:predicted RNA-binding protein with RPS1 domain